MNLKQDCGCVCVSGGVGEWGSGGMGEWGHGGVGVGVAGMVSWCLLGRQNVGSNPGSDHGACFLEQYKWVPAIAGEVTCDRLASQPAE